MHYKRIPFWTPLVNTLIYHHIFHILILWWDEIRWQGDKQFKNMVPLFRRIIKCNILSSRSLDVTYSTLNSHSSKDNQTASSLSMKSQAKAIDTATMRSPDAVFESISPSQTASIQRFVFDTILWLIKRNVDIDKLIIDKNVGNQDFSHQIIPMLHGFHEASFNRTCQFFVNLSG